jgi:hypothetical protein
MSASLWDMWKIYNWWWLPQADSETTEEVQQKDEKPQRKKRTPVKKKTIKEENQIKEISQERFSKSEIQLDLDPVILDQLRLEAQEKSLTISQLIEQIIELHLESKVEPTTEVETFSCALCEPQEEFTNYFEYSNHFFVEHMQPDLQKLSQNASIL